MKVTMFERFSRVVGQFEVGEVIGWIREGRYRAEVEAIRAAIDSGDKKRAEGLKKGLPGVTFSACFEGGRLMRYLVRYNRLIVLDLDGVEVAKVAGMVRQEEYTLACFRSPGGRGLKILVRVDGEKEQHKAAFQLVADYYERLLGVVVDRSGKDITRLCFLSWDEAAYCNPEARIFEVKTGDRGQEELKMEKEEAIDELEAMLAYTQRKQAYQNGNRNNFLYQFAANCNRVGLNWKVVMDYCKANLDLGVSEIESTVMSAYSHNQKEFGAKMNALPKKRSRQPEQRIDYKNTPCFPTEVYENLPVFLKENCKLFKTDREKDVFLSSALCVLSASLSNLSGLYHGRETYPNLYSLILAPAASGKSVMSYARMLGEAYEASLQQQYQAEKSKFDKAIQEGQHPEALKRPKRALFFIPANSSASRVIEHLKEGQGSGLICETEADTLGNVLKQDWGGYSDILRKAYSGEPISHSRQTGNAYVSLIKTRLSVLMTGTLNQLFELIPSAENGLFSRFLFYTYQLPPVWQDVSPRGQQVNLSQHFREESRKLMEMIRFWKEREVKFELSEGQWEVINEQFSRLLSRSVALYGAGADATVKRYGNALYRIAMILSACRSNEEVRNESILQCKEVDFEIASQLVEVYLEHAMIVLERLPSTEKVRSNKLPNHKRLFFEALPSAFKRNEAIALGLRFEMKPRTVDRLLKELKGVCIKDGGFGYYEKL